MTDVPAAGAEVAAGASVGGIAVGGAAVGIVCGLHAVANKTRLTNALIIRRVVFIFLSF